MARFATTSLAAIAFAVSTILGPGVCTATAKRALDRINPAGSPWAATASMICDTSRDVVASPPTKRSESWAPRERTAIEIAIKPAQRDRRMVTDAPQCEPSLRRRDLDRATSAPADRARAGNHPP